MHITDDLLIKNIILLIFFEGTDSHPYHIAIFDFVSRT